MRYIIILLLTLLSSNLNNYKLSKAIEDNYFIKYSRVISSIMVHEGLRNKVYYCAGGNKTIGYGHLVTKDTFNILSDSEALDLLKDDFNKCILYTQKYTTNIDTLLGISHFIFCFGSTKFNKSLLKQKLLKGECIEEELIRWININGKPSSHLKKRREFEIRLIRGERNKDGVISLRHRVL